jgi:hypothetical protein
MGRGNPGYRIQELQQFRGCRIRKFSSGSKNLERMLDF